MIRSLTVDETNNLMLGQYGVCFLNVRSPILAKINGKYATVAGVPQFVVESITLANNTAYTTASSLPSGSRIIGGSGATAITENTYLVNTGGIYQLYNGDDSSAYGTAVGSAITTSATTTTSYIVYYGWGATQANSQIDNDKYKTLTTSGINFTTTINTAGRNYGGGRAWRTLSSPSNVSFSTIQVALNYGITFSDIRINGEKLFPSYSNGGNYDYITLEKGQSINGNITSFEARNSSTNESSYFLAYINPKYL